MTAIDFLILTTTFGAFLLSILGWGILLERSSFSLTLSFVTGVGIAILFPQALSSFGWLGSRTPALIFIVIGIAALAKNYRVLKMDFSLKRLSRVETVLLLSFLVFFICRFFEASLLQPHGDPLYYNLLSAAKWRQLGSIQFIPTLPLLYQSGWWDYLYLWPAMIFQVSPNAGLMEAQIFSQWLHFVVGMAGSLFVWNYILKNLNVERWIRWVSGLAMVACASLWWTASLAKNDWGCVFLFLGGLAFLLDRRIFLGGIFWGMAFASKWTLLFTLLPFLLFYIWTWGRKDKINSIKLLCGFTFAVLPIALRNFFATGNPMFPIPIGELGKEYLSESFWIYIRSYTGNLFSQDWTEILKVRSKVIFESPFLLLSLVLTLFLLSKKIRQRRLSQPRAEILVNFYWLSWIGFLLFSLKSGSSSENRLYGAGLIVMVGLGAVLVAQYMKHRYWQWALIILTLATSRIPTFMPQKFFKEWPLRIENVNAGDLKLKIQREIVPGAKILTTGDNEHYFLSSYDIADLPNHPTLDARVRRKSDVIKALTIIHEEGYRYLLHAKRYDGYCWEGFCQQLERVIANSEGAKAKRLRSLTVLESPAGFLLDLDRLSAP